MKKQFVRTQQSAPNFQFAQSTARYSDVIIVDITGV